jgi:uncharacterized protein GlcG (DUF336 family)
MGLKYSDGVRILEAALAKAEEIGCAMSVAVLDEGREILAFGRQDGAPLISVDVALNKAHTARSMNMPTGDIGPLTQPGQPLYGFETAAGRPIITFAGGQPVKVDGVVVGAVGVSGGSPDQDDEVARAGAGALEVVA